MSKQPKTDEEWAEYLRQEISGVTGDTEAAHRTADWVLIEFVKAQGFMKLAEAWSLVPKWYS